MIDGVATLVVVLMKVGVKERFGKRMGGLNTERDGTSSETGGNLAS